MMKRKTPGRAALLVAFAGLASSLASSAHAAPWQMNVAVDKPGARINPNLYGLMTEEINHAYDGGLYAELIQNRIFKDDANAPIHWSLVQDGGGTGSMALDRANPLNDALDVSLRLQINAGGRRVGVANDGFWGVPVKPNTAYRVSFWAKASADFTGPLTVGIESTDGKNPNLAAFNVTVPRLSAVWKKYSVALRTGAVQVSSNNRFVISANQPGTIWMTLVSLFPPTFNNRPNGKRVDLMQKMAAMKPAFLRFPGGNHLDPGHLEWKKTIGPLEARPSHPGSWGYRSSDGIGIMEFLQWCDDLNMEPLLAVTDGRGWLPANGDVKPLVQDALDEIEYLTGPVTSPWGAKRARDGHPAPVKLRYVEIGNEDWFDPLSVYEFRYPQFHDAIRARYPQLKIIATRGDLQTRRPDMVDDHIYASATGMMNASRTYDTYDRSRPPIFVGEWATTEGRPTPTLRATLGDAAYLTGLERNADIVKMACYAPGLVNVNPGAWQWPTNLIGYDANSSFGSPSYFMQVMFNTNRGDVVLPLNIATPDAPAVPAMPRGAVGVGTWNTQAEFRDARITPGEGGGDLIPLPAVTDDAAWRKDLGQWNTQNGVLAQTGNDLFARAIAGNPQMTDYSFSVKARKTGGAEGFLIFVHAQDANNLVWWNIGGWGNSRSALQRIVGGEKSDFGASAPVTVETGRWYDIRVEVKGRRIRCYLDGKLITEATEAPVAPLTPIFASASRDLTSGDIILKVVNTDAAPQQIAFNLQGARNVGRTATGQVLSGDPDAMNSLIEPTRVAPRPLTLTGVGPKFTREFPAHSVSVFRIKTR